jgi:hypothetical protein
MHPSRHLNWGLSKCGPNAKRWRMTCYGMLRRVALVRTTRRNISEGPILHSNRRENLKSYNANHCPTTCTDVQQVLYLSLLSAREIIFRWT